MRDRSAVRLTRLAILATTRVTGASHALQQAFGARFQRPRNSAIITVVIPCPIEALLQDPCREL